MIHQGARGDADSIVGDGDHRAEPVECDGKVGLAIDALRFSAIVIRSTRSLSSRNRARELRRLHSLYPEGVLSQSPALAAPRPTLGRFRQFDASTPTALHPGSLMFDATPLG